MICLVGLSACEGEDDGGTLDPTDGPAVPEEVQIGDRDAGTFSVEVSPDMRFLVWQEIIAGAAGPIWSCGLDPTTGGLVPEDGRGFRLDGIPSTAAPQWGLDQDGVFFVTLDSRGRFLIVRPTAFDTATVTMLPTPADATRAYPYPTRLPARDGAFIAFLQADPDGRPQVHVLDTARPMEVRALTSGAIDFTGDPPAPAFVVTVYRWFPESTELAWGYNDAAGRLQVRALDVAAASATPAAITDEPHDHIDSFPGLLDGEQVLVGGIDGRDRGALYRRGGPATPFRIAKDIEQSSALANPMMSASFEPFEWEGSQYASYIVLDGGRKPGDSPAEVWMVDLGTGATTRLSSSTPRNRMDPEVFLGRDEAFVLFYARPPDASGFRLYRARTGLVR